MNAPELPGLSIDPARPEPPYEQIRAGIGELVAGGALGPGERLPTVRRLAADLGLATNTVARAYRELEHAGVVVTRGRGGTVVSGDRSEQEARAAAAAYVDRLRALGVDEEQAVGLVRHAYDRPASS